LIASNVLGNPGTMIIAFSKEGNDDFDKINGVVPEGHGERCAILGRNSAKDVTFGTTK